MSNPNAELELVHIFATGSFVLLVGLLVGSIFFLITCLRALREDHMEGTLYGAVSLFFAIGHVYYLLNIPDDSSVAYVMPEFSIWAWLVFVFAPALIGSFLLYTMINWVMARTKAGFFSLFFGATLAAFLFFLGQTWPVDVRGVITIGWTFLFFAVQLETAF